MVSVWGRTALIKSAARRAPQKTLWPSVLRSRFVRLAIAIAIFPTVILCLVGALTYERYQNQLTLTYDLRLNHEIASLAEIYALRGQSGLVETVEARLKMYPSDSDQILYGVFIDPLERVAGNLRPKQTTVGFVENDGQRFRVTPLDGSLSIAVGTATQGRTEALSALFKDLLIAIIACFLGCMLLGILSARLFARRLANMNQLIDAVAEGNIDVRLPVDQSGDEISALSTRINHMLGRIQHLIRLRKSISDQVAHEIRTPLTHLDTTLARVVESSSEPEPVLEAKAAVKHCVALLDDLLDVSSLEAQIGDRQGFEPLDLSHAAHRIFEFYDALAEDKGLRLTTESRGNSRIFADPAQIDRLIVNLVDNAIKYTPEGGNVIIKTQGLSSQVILTVSDDGPGIEKDDRQSVFEPFFRQAGHSNKPGHGLGLSLVKAIADRHDGHLLIDDGLFSSNKAQGTSVAIRFPTYKEGTSLRHGKQK